MRQSDRLGVYRKALQDLWDRDALFACSCSRRDIAQAMSAPQEGVHTGPDGVIYPGTCRAHGSQSGSIEMPDNAALRLLMGFAAPHAAHAPAGNGLLSFQETGQGPNGETGLIEFSAQSAIETIGDVVLARRDMGTSYHLSVVLDDASQGVTHVVRGTDLFDATRIHVILQRLLGIETPVYHHHALIRDETGKRLAKRDDARAIALYRQEGASPQDIRRMVGL